MPYKEVWCNATLRLWVHLNSLAERRLWVHLNSLGEPGLPWETGSDFSTTATKGDVVPGREHGLTTLHLQW